MMTTLFRFKYHYCKNRMIAYLNGELPTASRRRMARYIDECPHCYNEYTKQRALHRELMDSLGRFGQPQTVQLDRIWSAVQGELFIPAHKPRLYHRYSLRYGLATMAVMLVLVLPLFMRGNTIAQASITQPEPNQSAIVVTQAPQIAQAVLLDTTQDVNLTNIRPEAAPQRTPESGK